MAWGAGERCHGTANANGERGSECDATRPASTAERGLAKTLAAIDSDNPLLFLPPRAEAPPLPHLLVRMAVWHVCVRAGRGCEKPMTFWERGRFEM